MKFILLFPLRDTAEAWPTGVYLKILCFLQIFYHVSFSKQLSYMKDVIDRALVGQKTQKYQTVFGWVEYLLPHGVRPCCW